MVRVGDRKLELALFHRQLDGLAAAIRRDGRDAVHRRGEGLLVDVHLLVVVLGGHPVVIGERALDQLAQQHYAAQRDADLGVRELDLDIAVGAFEQLLHFRYGLFRHDDAGHALGPGGRVGLGARHAVAIGGDRTQRRGAADLQHVHVDAVEVVARLFVGDGELRAFDQFAQRRRRNRETMGEGAGLEVGRQARQVEARAAGGHQQLLGAFVLEPDLGAIRELADDFVERVRGHRGGAGLADHGRHAFGHLDVEVGGAQVELAVRGLQQHVGEDGVGIAALHHAVDMPQRLEQMVALESDFHKLKTPTQTAIARPKPGQNQAETGLRHYNSRGKRQGTGRGVVSRSTEIPSGRPRR